MNFAVFQYLFLFFVTTAAQLLADIPACKTGPNHDECLAKNIQNFILKYGKTGIPEINLPRFDPMELDSLTIKPGKNIVNMVQNFKNVNVSGYTDSPKVTNAHWDPENLNLTFTTAFPKLEQNAQYDINGKILVYGPVYGNGNCTVNFTGIEIKHSLRLVKENRNNDVFFNVSSYVAEVLNMQRLSFFFENLFDGNEVKGDKVNKLLDDEWKTVYDDVIDGYVESYTAVVRQYANWVFAKIPASSILSN